MKFEFSDNPLDEISSDAAIVFAFTAEEKKKETYLPSKSFEGVDKALKGQLTRLAEADNFKASKGEILSLFPPSGTILPTKVYVLGLGKKDEFILDYLRTALGSFAMKMKRKIDSVSLAIPDDLKELSDTASVAHVTVEALSLGCYEFAKYKTKEKGERNLQVCTFAGVMGEENKQLQQAVTKAEHFAKATILARDLVNEQPTDATPTFLANLAKDIAKASPSVTCKVIEKADAQRLGMNAFLGIARAAETPPKFIHLEYKPQKGNSKDKIALVGKGITFDSGGINVKPGDHMQDMKMDMSGAAAVLGVFSVIDEIAPSVGVIGLIAATPNLISGKGIVPGDVVKAMNGKTIEVLNTDAEGRVTLADSLSYAVKQKATKIIELSTLTGACLVALGADIAGLMSNSKALSESLKIAAHDAGEKVWELPLDKDYKSLNKSSVADIANIPNTRYGGTITAGLFLEAFVENTPFVHLDIAGPAFFDRPHGIGPKGGSGFGVRTLLTLLNKHV